MSERSWNFRPCEENALLQKRWAIFRGKTDPVRAFALSEDDARRITDALNDAEEKSAASHPTQKDQPR